MNTPLIRPSGPQDAAAIHAVHAAAFPTEDEARLVDLLIARGKGTVSLAAELDGQVVGHVLFSPVSVERENEPAAGAGRAPVGLGLAPLAVLPAFQRQGIGARLVTAGLDACRALGVDYAVVLGDPAYYGRFGFRRADVCGLSNEYVEGPEFMVLELTPGALEGVRGMVRYAPEFGELEV